MSHRRPADSPSSRFRGRLVPIILAPLLAVACAVLQWWLDRWSLGVAFDTYLTWQRVAANAAVGAVAMLLLAALTRRLLWSILLVTVFEVLVFAASAMKVRFLGMPLVLQDAYFVTGIDLSSAHLLSEYVTVSWRVGLGIAAALVAFVALFRFEPAWCRKRSMARLVAFALSATLLAGLYFATWPWTAGWYDKAHVRPSPLGLSQATLHGGLVASMVYYHGVQRNREFSVDAGALRDTIAAVGGLAPPAPAATGDPQRPDVVIVLSESFMDPRVLNGMQAVPDVIPRLRAQIDAGNGGYMLAPTFGGGTVRTEFEVLTGMPVEAFPDVYYPYVDMTPASLPGIVGALEKHGYASLALHGNSGAFWNRTNTYEAMGVDRFLTQAQMAQAGATRDGGWLSDRSMTDILLRELDRATRPTVAVAISIENHGPYDKDYAVTEPEQRAGIELPEGLGKEGDREFRNYLYHLHHADIEFGRLLAGLRARHRPFVLLFFGDHLPSLGEAYDKLGFVNGLDAPAQYVPWALVSEGVAPAATAAEGGSRSGAVYAWQLPAMLWASTGLGGEPWFDFLGRVGTRLDPAGRTTPDPALLSGLYAGANARLTGRFDREAGSK